MAKKKQKEEVVLSAFDKLYGKYGKSKDMYTPPKDLGGIELDAERIKNPFMSLDRFLGGGPAKGKITTFSALASSGKTSLALAIAGANEDSIVGFLDQEYNWTDSSYLWVDKYFGIEKERIMILQPTWLEEGAEMIEDMCDVCDIVIQDGFDSIAPKGEFEASMEASTMGLQARAYKKFFRRSMGKIYKSKAALIITNHLYENIGNQFEPFKEPGGKSIHDYASQKLYMTRANIKDSAGKIIGQKVNCNIYKDKLTGNRGTKFSLPYNNKEGFDIEEDIVNNAIDLGVMQKSGSWYKYDGVNIGQGSTKTGAVLRDNPDLALEIINRCKELF